MSENNFIITLSCEDRPFIVANITSRLAELGANIETSNQFWDKESNYFFMRIQIAFQNKITVKEIQTALNPIIAKFNMQLSITNMAVQPKIIIMVSKFDHALRRLLYQIKIGRLNAKVLAIISNHENARSIAQSENIDFFHWPINKENKFIQEQKLLNFFVENNVDLIVLARYMQILSAELANKLAGKIINIHHSFLPSFKGAKPYHQAFERGVKIIGATAHYVTPELDEGPIIEQDIAHIDHTYNVKTMIMEGEEIESRVLARAVRLHLEKRIMLNGKKTIIFKG